MRCVCLFWCVFCDVFLLFVVGCVSVYVCCRVLMCFFVVGLCLFVYVWLVCVLSWLFVVVLWFDILLFVCFCVFCVVLNTCCL